MKLNTPIEIRPAANGFIVFRGGLPSHLMPDAPLVFQSLWALLGYLKEHFTEVDAAVVNRD